jgi:hypothetical protein
MKAKHNEILEREQVQKTPSVAEQETLFQKWAEEDGGTLAPPPHPDEIKSTDDLRHVWFTKIIGNSC